MMYIKKNIWPVESLKHDTLKVYHDLHMFETYAD